MYRIVSTEPLPMSRRLPPSKKALFANIKNMLEELKRQDS